MAQTGNVKRARLLFASAAGTIIEWYDFFIFVTCAVLVFNKAFFPSEDPTVGTSVTRLHPWSAVRLHR